MSFKPNIFKRTLHYLVGQTLKFRAKKHKKKINNYDFSIISNNCWGGIAYEYYGLQKQSPTIGAYFFPDEYISFVGHLEQYLKMELTIISLDDSLHKKEIIDSGSEKAIIGKLEGTQDLPPVEIVFLHYSDKNVVLEKWERRRTRVNYQNLIFKFSYQNGCTAEHLATFDSLKLPGKKIMFVKNATDVSKYNCAIYYPGFENNEQIENDTFYWNKYFDVDEFINCGVLIPKK